MAHLYDLKKEEQSVFQRHSKILLKQLPTIPRGVIEIIADYDRPDNPLNRNGISRIGASCIMRNILIT